MTDIVIYTNPETLLHKQDKLPNDDDKSDDGSYFWDTSRNPKRFEIGDRVYFATKGFVRGSFKSYSIIEWFSKTWKPLKNLIPCKPFRGFRYKWW